MNLEPGLVDVDLEHDDGTVERLPIPRILERSTDDRTPWRAPPYATARGLPRTIVHAGRRFDLDDDTRAVPLYRDAGPAPRR